MRRIPSATALAGVPAFGEMPDKDPAYGAVYRILEEVKMNLEELRDEVWFDCIEVDGLADQPAVYLVAEQPLRRIARACMTGPHVDDHLVIMDPDHQGGGCHWTPWN